MMRRDGQHSGCHQRGTASPAPAPIPTSEYREHLTPLSSFQPSTSIIRNSENNSPHRIDEAIRNKDGKPRCLYLGSPHSQASADQVPLQDTVHPPDKSRGRRSQARTVSKQLIACRLRGIFASFEDPYE